MAQTQKQKDASRAFALRSKLRQGKSINAKDTAWLDAYERAHPSTHGPIPRSPAQLQLGPGEPAQRAHVERVTVTGTVTDRETGEQHSVGPTVYEMNPPADAPPPIDVDAAPSSPPADGGDIPRAERMPDPEPAEPKEPHKGAVQVAEMFKTWVDVNNKEIARAGLAPLPDLLRDLGAVCVYRMGERYLPLLEELSNPWVEAAAVAGTFGYVYSQRERARKLGRVAAEEREGERARAQHEPAGRASSPVPPPSSPPDAPPGFRPKLRIEAGPTLGLDGFDG